jgi:hypothetical protein
MTQKTTPTFADRPMTQEERAAFISVLATLHLPLTDAQVAMMAEADRLVGLGR